MTVRALALLVLVVAWAGLVWLAIAAGRSARDGDALAWVWLALAALGAVAALAAALAVGTRLVRREEPRPRGGKHR
ncbi:hypothetical protein [Nocardioides caldifontis]|uniref:hypothetical protein n=1 Tax=Nocardioides caldifontis TaxID=2588938 RepID=UPI0011DFBF23|nr:hypothetical protein [Nocardioides caldifontis]